ncbi:ATP-binding protein [Streptomyces axinellae]|uniref:ATP-binding protein n=1 Tax=Streptomyces axinellae TaxID=552788 RepID=A0ABN3Q9H5_9ACTN
MSASEPDAARPDWCASSQAARDTEPNFRTYRATPESVGHARAFVRGALADHLGADRADDILVCVSELATNAIEHGTPPSPPPGREFLVRAAVEGDTLRVEVHDVGDGRPEPRKATADDDNGRGLFLVACLADDWGVTTRTGTGKVVWAEFKLAAGPAVIAC